MQKSLNSQLMQQISQLMPHFCDRCGYRHNKTDFEVVNVESDKVICKLECTNCKNVYLFHVNSPGEGVLNTKRASFKADINGAEVKKFSNMDNIEDEEILDVYMALKDIKNIKDFDVLFDSDNI